MLPCFLAHSVQEFILEEGLPLAAALMHTSKHTSGGRARHKTSRRFPRGRRRGSSRSANPEALSVDVEAGIKIKEGTSHLL